MGVVRGGGRVGKEVGCGVGVQEQEEVGISGSVWGKEACALCLPKEHMLTCSSWSCKLAQVKMHIINT